MSNLLLLILAVVALELCGLALFHVLSGRGPPLMEWVPNLMAGASLLVALWISLVGGGPLGILVCLGLAGVFHVIDLRRRWRG